MKSLFFVALISTLALSACVVAPHTRYIASNTVGHLSMNGAPVAGVRVTREVTVLNTREKLVQDAITDARGDFVWPELTKIGLVESIGTWTYMFRFYAQINGEKTLFWKGGKTDHFRRFLEAASNGSYLGFPSGQDFFRKKNDCLYFVCDLSTLPKHPVDDSD